MPAPFTAEEALQLGTQLWDLYIIQNKPIGEIGKILHINQSTVYDRLKSFAIPILPSRKEEYLNKKKVKIPDYSVELAEFTGIMLGDGHISATQIWITSHAYNDREYHEYIKQLIKKLFCITPKSLLDPKGHTVNCYTGSVSIVRFFKKMGLVENKVKMQVHIPHWIFKNKEYQKACLRGLIDTDGSVYELYSGSIQISFTNRSKPLLQGVRKILLKNGFHPSKISGDRVYLTRKLELERYFEEIGTSNQKHRNRYESFRNLNYTIIGRIA